MRFSLGVSRAHLPSTSAALASRAPRFVGSRVCAIMAALAIGGPLALGLAGCAGTAPKRPVIVQMPVVEAPVAAAGPVRNDRPEYFRLAHTPRDHTPVRVALLLPLTNPSADTRAVAEALQRAAQIALFDSGNADIILMPRDDGGSPASAARAAARAIADGAEIILGPLFAQSVTAVAPIAREQNVPVIAFSSDRAVASRGVYLLSFQPEDEVNRIVSYSARKGHSAFAAMVPQTAYGQKVGQAFRDAVAKAGGQVTAVGTFPEVPELVADPARNVAASHPDAVLIGEGGDMLRAVAPALALDGASNATTKFLGTGLWDDPLVGREPMLINGWFAAPSPAAWRSFAARYQSLYGNAPPRIASLAYDAMSLVVLLANGKPYQRYTDATLTDPNGFTGIDGIFRFHDDGSAERGLAIMQVGAGGSTILDPAPQTFQAVGF